jgi:glycosyltransferase involved in cell wall biosynthesis
LLKQRDQDLARRLQVSFEPVVDTTMSRIARRAAGLRTRVGNAIHRTVGAENLWQLGYAVQGLCRGVRATRPDLVIAHSEAALAAVSSLGGECPRIAVDMEDWFSEDLLPEARRTRPLTMLKTMEKAALSRAKYSTCPSAAMSCALARAYGCAPPRVVYNAFAWRDRGTIDGKLRDRTTRERLSIHWFSQTLGPGRGLEDLLAALPLLDPAPEIHLRGHRVPGLEEWLSARVPVDRRADIYVHEPVSNEELLSRIAEHDIGFAGEMLFCASRNLTVTNKILHYLLGGLAVVASDTAGQREVAAKAPGALSLYPSGDASALADALNMLMRDRASLDAAKDAALSAAREVFCWEKQAPALLAAVAAALA